MTTLAMPKPHRDRAIEGMMAKWYAANTAEVMNEYSELAQRISRQIAPGSRVLEVAPGPGYFCMELAKLGNYSITGLDISHTFVKMATKKAAEAGLRIDFQQGSASNLPFPRDNFDFLVCRAAFKNFAKPVAALEEMFRVLRPDGRALIIDMRGDVSPQILDEHVDRMSLSRINWLLTRLAFKTMLVKSAYTKDQVGQMLVPLGFNKVEIVEANIGMEISLTK